LDSFDTKLRLEQQKTAQERDARQTAVSTLPASEDDSSSASHGDGGARSAPVGAQGEHRGGASRSEDSHDDLKSDRAAGNRSAACNGTVAADIPDGNDDDVVARRLRKAAEQETDPELKDKLWKEYVEYKKNTQTR
jgi:hypothetical protein